MGQAHLAEDPPARALIEESSTQAVHRKISPIFNNSFGPAGHALFAEVPAHLYNVIAE